MSTAWFPPLHEPDALARAGRALSLGAWADLGEDEPGELVDGHLVEEEIPDAVHELAVTWLIAVVRAWLGTRGFVFGSEVKLAMFPKTGRKADLCVYLPGRAPPPKRGPLREAPDVVVEVVTPSPRDERGDRVEKMDEYARFGVRSYWIVDPALGSFEIFSLEADGRYKRSVGVTGGVIDVVPSCEGLRLDVDALWAELARLSDDPA